jgi:hypothetical protein
MWSAQTLRIFVHASFEGVWRQDKPLRRSSSSDARVLLAGAAAGASTPIRSTRHLISDMIRWSALTVEPAASLNGLLATISLLPRPRGTKLAKGFGMSSGVCGGSADTTQIGSRLPAVQATSIPR